MASITRRIEVCDVCRDVDAPIAKHVRLADEGDRLRTVALCQKDLGLPILDLLRALAKGAPAPTPGRGGSRKVTLEQIEEIKKTRGRAKKTTAPKRPRKAAQKPA